MNKNMGGLLKQAQEMQIKMQKAQEEVAHLEIKGESGAGLVQVIVTGTHQCKGVTIDKDLLDEDKDILEDLIAAAFNDAVKKIESKSQAIMSEVSSGINLPAGFKLPF